MQTSNLTDRHEQQINLGKAVLAIASAKSKEVHKFFILVCTTFAFTPTLKIRFS